MFCPQDAAFGPTSTCRSFDFTLYFSNSILVIIPSALMVAACLVRSPLLLRKPDLRGARSSQHDAVGIARIGAHAVHAVIAAAILGLTTIRPDIKQALEAQTIVPALVLSFLASLLALPLSMLERRKTPRGAIVLPLWLFATALFDACRLRTFSHVAAADHSAFLPLSAAALAVKVAMLALENTSGVQQHTSPEARASFFSQLTFIWLYPVIWRGYRKPLELQDLDELADDFKSKELHSIMQAAWKPRSGSSSKLWNRSTSQRKNSDEIEAIELENRSSSAAGLTSDEDLDANQEPPRGLLKALFFAFPIPLLAPIVPRLIMVACTLSQPFLVSKTLGFAQSYEGQDTAKEQPTSYGWGLVGAYALVYTTLAFSTGQYFWLSSKTMCKVRGGLIELIYHKSLKLHVESAKRTGGGAAANLMSVDLERLVKCIDPLHNLWSGLVIIVAGIYLLYLQLGLVFLSTVLAIIITLTLPPVMSSRLGERQKAWSMKTDERVNLLASAIKDAKGVKLSAYEDAISAQLIEARNVELSMMHRYLQRLTTVIVATNVTSELMSLVTFSTLAVVDLLSGSRSFTLNKVFSALTVIAILEAPLLSLGQQYAALLSAYSSLNRIEEFLREKERPSREGTSATPSRHATPAPSFASSDRKDRSLANPVMPNDREDDGSVAAQFERTTIGWNDKAVLVNVDLRIPSGRLTMVCGRITSGKSTMLQALLGEADVMSGSSHLPLLRKPVAYCAQDCWLMEAASIRDNIVFDDLWDAERYQTALHATALDVDMQQLSSNDRTAVSMLSGGQRQRVALARALYSDADAYILDDVTSALDAETASHVWRSILGPQGLLKGKTVVFASNALELLHHADLVVRLEGGKVAESGRFEDLSVKGKGAISRASIESNDVAGTSRRKADVPTTDPREDDKGEEVETGTVPWKVYGVWLKAGGLRLVYTSLVLVIINVSAVHGMPVWLQAWARQNDRQPNDASQTGMRIGVYLIIAVSCATALTCSFYLQFITINGRAGRRLHKDELRGVMGTNLQFFTSNPAGRIINRFSQDLFSIDWELAIAAFNVLATGLSLIGQIILMCVPAPYLLALVALLSCFYVAMQRLYMPASRQLRRLEMSTKSPLYTLFAETSSETGLATIRALRREELFLRQHSARLDLSQRPYYTLWAVRRWLLTNLNLMGMAINVCLVALVVLLRNNAAVGLLGVGLVQATNLSGNLNHVLVTYTDFEILGVALERVKAFKDLPAEEGPRADGLKRVQLDPAKIQGSIAVKNLTVAYTSDSETALRDLSFTMRPGERLGVCGRSGSGKSTLLLALFRMIDVRSGSIELDGQSIENVEVRSLRKSLSIVAQQPLMLAASIRDNLDPDRECGDDAIWDALEKIKLDAFVRSLPKGLQTMLLGSEVTLSAGQRQLLSLGRALLRKRRILILDEATSSLDYTSDAEVQEVLRTCFTDCTIIAVAHRLASIRTFDRILVLSNGVLAELDTPEALLNKTDGIFRSLCDEQGVH